MSKSGLLIPIERQPMHEQKPLTLSIQIVELGTKRGGIQPWRFLKKKPGQTTAEPRPHPRRYGLGSGSQKQAVSKFTGNLRARLHLIPSSEYDNPIEFSLVYVGYTSECQKRKSKHGLHNDQGCPVTR
jgi:hypothetical protein